MASEILTRTTTSAASPESTVVVTTTAAATTTLSIANHTFLLARDFVENENVTNNVANFSNETNN